MLGWTSRLLASWKKFAAAKSFPWSVWPRPAFSGVMLHPKARTFRRTHRAGCNPCEREGERTGVAPWNSILRLSQENCITHRDFSHRRRFPATRAGYLRPLLFFPDELLLP